MEKLDVVLVGVGGYANMYANYALDNAINVVGIVDPRPEGCTRLNEFVDKGISVYYNIDDFFKEHTADLAVITTPIHCHTPNIVSALKHGTNVLAEKPLCGDEKEIEFIDAAAKKHGSFAYIGYQWSFSKSILGLKKDILSGRFGKCLSMKTLVLWPRPERYFSRSWSGKVCSDSGALIYDSIANNAAAHYLHNLLFLIGDNGKSKMPAEINAQLFRTYDIETFDTIKLDMKFDTGTVAHYIASHVTNQEVDPIFELEFEKARVYYAYKKTALSEKLMPAEYTKYDNIMALTDTNENIFYGSPFNPVEVEDKITAAIESAQAGKAFDYACGYEAAGVHTRVINYIHNNFEIKNKSDYIIEVRDCGVWGKQLSHRVIKGLGEELMECYKNPTLKIK